MSDASPTELRDELARQLFIADNWRQPKEQSEDDWQEYPGVIAGVTPYHAQADAIMPAVVEAITKARAEGMRDAADILGIECSHQWQVDQNVARRMVVVGSAIRAQADETEPK